MTAETTRLTLADIRDRAVLSVIEAGQVLGLGHTGAYQAARAGSFPIIRINGRMRVPVPAFLRMLGEEPTRPDTDTTRAVTAGTGPDGSPRAIG